MRHQKFSQRLSRPLGHRRATLRNLVISLLKYQRIKTTLAKAKFAQSLAERIISLGRQNTLQSRRHALRILNDKIAVGELFSRIAPLFKNRPSGFTRIIRLFSRRGDGAEMALLELTEKSPQVKPKEVKEGKPGKEPLPREKPKAEIKPVGKVRPPKEKLKPIKKLKPRKFLGGLRRLFKKERDSL